jgi:hypothetical protein
MALSKIQAESMNLADTYAFSGTVSGTSVAGSNAFCARTSVADWQSSADGAILFFNDTSTGDCFDTDGVYNTSTYKFTAPATGVYTFWFSVYTALNDGGNGFTFLKNSTKLNLSLTASNKYISYSGVGTADHIQTASIIFPLTSGDIMAVVAAEQSDYYKGRCQWGGCRLA